MFLFIGMIGQAQVATKTAAVNTKVKEATCQKVCTHAACEAMVKLGLCTPEQAAGCQKDGKNVKMASNVDAAPKATQVAAVSMDKSNVVVATPKAKSKECAKTCAKTCKKKAN